MLVLVRSLRSRKRPQREFPANARRINTDNGTTPFTIQVADDVHKIHIPQRLSRPLRTITALPRLILDAFGGRSSAQDRHQLLSANDGPPTSTGQLPAPTGHKDSAATVEGRAIAPPASGFGQLWHKELFLTLHQGPAAPVLMEYWKHHLPELWPKGGDLYYPRRGFREGDVLGVEMGLGPAKLATGVLVQESTETSFTLLSPEGHMLAGWNRFAAHVTPEGTVASVTIEARASDPLYEAGLLLGGHRIEEWFWAGMLKNLAARFDQRPQVQKTRLRLDSRRQWRYASNVRNNAFIRTVTRRTLRLIGIGER